MNKIRILIVNDNKETLYTLKQLLKPFKEFKIVWEAFNGKEAVNSAVELEPDIILMDINMPIMDGFTAAKKISCKVPYIGIILMGSLETFDVIRKAMSVGAGDFLELPITIEKLRNSILSLYETKNLQKKYLVENSMYVLNRKPKVISVFSSKGGVGKSVVSVNTSLALRDQTKREVILIDMDLQFGDVSDMLNVDSDISIIDMVTAKKNIEVEDLEKYSIQHKSGIRVLAAPKQPEQADMVKMRDVKEIVGFFQKIYDFIVIDLPPLFNEITLGSLEMSDYIFIITTMEVPTIKNTKSSLEILSTLGYPEEKIILILNRFHKDSEIQLKDVKKFLGLKKIFCIDDSPSLVSTSINMGEPFILKYRDKKISKQIVELCKQVIDYYGNYKAREKLSFFKIFKRSRKGGI